MKFKSLILGLCVGLCSSAFASTQHGSAPAKNPENKSTEKMANWADYCDVEIINNSYQNVRVYGSFEDGSALFPFNIYSYEAPQYIHLWSDYYGYCQASMYLYIDTWSGYHVYSGFVLGGSTVYISPYLVNNQVKAEVRAK